MGRLSDESGALKFVHTYASVCTPTIPIRTCTTPR
jgi:hypothetical protein